MFIARGGIDSPSELAALISDLFICTSTSPSVFLMFLSSFSPLSEVYAGSGGLQMQPLIFCGWDDIQNEAHVLYTWIGRFY